MDKYKKLNIVTKQKSTQLLNDIQVDTSTLKITEGVDIIKMRKHWHYLLIGLTTTNYIFCLSFLVLIGRGFLTFSSESAALITVVGQFVGLTAVAIKFIFSSDSLQK